MPIQLDLTDEEREALIRLLRAGLDRDRFPLSPRVASMSNLGGLISFGGSNDREKEWRAAR
jgi:hypothetical protein